MPFDPHAEYVEQPWLADQGARAVEPTRVIMPTGLTTRDALAVVLIFALYLVMLSGIAFALPIRKLVRSWRRRWA